MKLETKLTLSDRNTSYPRRSFLIAAAVGAATLALDQSMPAIAAQSDYPVKPVRMIIPYGPGGATDIIFRLVGKEAEKYFGQAIVPVNMKGASATVGSRAVKNAEPDGYTILASHDTIALAYLAGTVDYSYDAFEPICLLTQTINIPSTYSKNSVQNARSMVDYVSKNPGKATIGIIPGSTDHFFWAQFFETAGISMDDVRLVGYPDTGSEVAALLAEEIDFAMLNMPSGESFFKAGTFRPLGVAHDKRLGTLPDVATLKEQGIDLSNATSRGIFAPKGTPKERLRILEDAFRQALENKDLVKRLETELGSIVRFLPQDKYQKFLTSNRDSLSKVADKVGFKK